MENQAKYQGYGIFMSRYMKCTLFPTPRGGEFVFLDLKEKGGGGGGGGGNVNPMTSLSYPLKMKGGGGRGGN